jgi:meso-butanediol dehydrogenase/(S,S)-butanediol dehydrogenase/diacetyl reductase
MAENKVAVVTGGGRGIGEGISRQLAADGYSVVIADLNLDNAKKVAESLNKEGKKAVAVEGDVTQPEAHEMFIKTAVDNFGRLDTYVNNAGIVLVKTLMDTSAEELKNIFNINTMGMFYGTKAAIRQFNKQDDGDKMRHIISASSIAGHFSFKLLGAYSMTKFAVRGLTQAFAQEQGQNHININAYCPGIVDTPMWDKIDADYVKIFGGHKGQYLEAQKKSIAQGVLEYPKDVAGLVSFLASDKSNYITGQAIQVDGGMIMI